MAQQPAAPSGATWIQDWLVQPAIVLAGVGLFVRLVLVPAIAKLMRTEFKTELDAIGDHGQRLPAVEERARLNEEGLAALQEVPVALARIEANLAVLMERRRDDRSIRQ